MSGDRATSGDRAASGAGSARPLRVRVELTQENDATAHALAHAADRKADRTPYGLHHLADTGDVSVAFRPSLHRPATAWLARKVRNRLDGFEVVGGLLGALAPERRAADAVLCLDERTSVPAALTPGGPPVVGNIIWLGRPEQYPRATREVLRAALHRMAVVFTQSPPLTAELAAAWDLDPERVVDVRLGVDPEFFPPQPWPGADAPAVVASVGDDPYRDHALLVDSVRRLRDSGVDARLELGTMIPDVAVPAEIGVLHRRRMEGAVRAMYRRSGAVALAVHPSTRGTGSTVVLEAAASARPVVATRTPAMEALVGRDGPEGERGILVPPGDPDAFAAALRGVLADPERARAMGRAARTWLERERTSAHMAADLRAALERAVALGPPRSARPRRG